MCPTHDAVATMADAERTARWIANDSAPALKEWELAIIKGMNDGSVPSAVLDLGTISGVGRPSDPLDGTGIRSDKVFRMPTGITSKAGWLKKMKYNLRPPARDMHETADINLASLINNGKLADADYGSVIDDKRANVQDLRTTTTRAQITFKGKLF